MAREKLPSRQRHGKLPRSTAKVRLRRSNGKPRGQRQGKSCRGTERQLPYGKWQGKVCRGKGQRTPVKWQRENSVAHGKLCRGQAARKLPSRQMARANLSRQAANFLGQRQMASLSKQGKGKFRRRPAARENFSGHGKGKLRANGKSKLPSRQMANGNGKVCRGKGQRTPVKWQRETVSVYGKRKSFVTPRQRKVPRQILPVTARQGMFPIRPVQRSHGM